MFYFVYLCAFVRITCACVCVCEEALLCARDDCLCASVFVSVFEWVSPDGNDSRAERGHMVMWQDSGEKLIRQNSDLLLRPHPQIQKRVYEVCVCVCVRVYLL